MKNQAVKSQKIFVLYTTIIKILKDYITKIYIYIYTYPDWVDSCII